MHIAHIRYMGRGPLWRAEKISFHGRVYHVNIHQFSGPDPLTDQTARNSADTVIAALESSGFNPARCVQGLTDGAEAAKNEAKLVLSAMHTRHCDAVKASRGPPPQPRGKQQQQPMPPLPVQRSVRESCAIHAKALEERAFLEAAFPTLVEALRLIRGNS